MDDFVFSDLRTGLGRGLEGLAETARNMQGTAAAATAGARALGGFKKSMGTVGGLATEPASMPLPGEAVEPVAPSSRLDGTTVRCGPASQGRESEVWGVDPPSGTLRPLYIEGAGDMEHGDRDGWKLERLVTADGPCPWRDRREAQ